MNQLCLAVLRLRLTSVWRTEFAARQPNSPPFAAFSSRCKAYLSASSTPKIKPAILCTGGIRSAEQIRCLLSQNAADLIGIGRPACLRPDLPAYLAAGGSGKELEPKGTEWLEAHAPVRIVGAGFSTGWHVFQLWRIARGETVAPHRSFVGLAALELWNALLFAICSHLRLLCCLCLFTIAIAIFKSGTD